MNTDLSNFENYDDEVCIPSLSSILIAVGMICQVDKDYVGAHDTFSKKLLLYGLKKFSVLSTRVT